MGLISQQFPLCSSALFTVQSLKVTLLHFRLDKMDTSAATRPGFELNFLVVPILS